LACVCFRWEAISRYTGSGTREGTLSRRIVPDKDLTSLEEEAAMNISERLLDYLILEEQLRN